MKTIKATVCMALNVFANVAVEQTLTENEKGEVTDMDIKTELVREPRMTVNFQVNAGFGESEFPALNHQILSALLLSIKKQSLEACVQVAAAEVEEAKNGGDTKLRVVTDSYHDVSGGDA